MNKRLNRIFALLLLLPFLAFQGCTKLTDDVLDSSNKETENREVSYDNLTEDEILALRANNIKRGRLIVKLSDSGLRSLGTNPNVSEEISLRSFDGNTQSALRSIGTKKMTRLFPHAGKFEERTKKAGLDRWMILDFDEGQGVAETRALVGDLEAFEVVEFSYAQCLPNVKSVPVTDAQLRNLENPQDRTSSFNDPFLKFQWHYSNDGSRYLSKAGADINLFEAWKVSTGTPNVKVCVVDGGIDFSHEDLKANLDLENSYNFIRNRNGEEYGQDIYPDSEGHGTHVAGTVAAVNNNGIGVAGVAGGDGSPNSGITIINAQVFGYPNDDTPSASVGIKYGADHGAVISQNSWGYRYPGPRSVPQHDKEAIDYFIKYAGMDETGENQLPDSPMAGGVVIFAAGNDYVEFESTPAMYPEVIAVSAMAMDFSKSLFTNQGDWVDIMAPGGDQERFGDFGGVFSTLPRDKYGFMQGTSMACPHVSGIAALVVSKYGKKGFTNNDLKRMLTTALRPYDINAYNHPNYHGKLGVGYIDAARALDPISTSNKAPENPSAVESLVDFSKVELKWRAAKDIDAHSGLAQFYELYISTSSISDVKSLENEAPIKVFGESVSADNMVSCVLSDLKDAQKYYFALRAVDRWGAKSKFVQGEFLTKTNSAPEIIKGLNGSALVLPDNSKLEFDLEVQDPEGHSWTFEKAGDLRGVSLERTSTNTIHLTIYPEQPVGEYKFTLKLIDEYHKAKEYPITYKVVKYEEPRFLLSNNEVVIGLNDKDFKLALLDKVKMTHGLSPKFTVSGSNTGLDAKVDANDLVLNPQSTGLYRLTLRCNDGFSSTSTTVNVRVVKDSEALVNVIYPVPVKTNLNIVLHRDVKKATFVVTSNRGESLIRVEKSIDESRVTSLDVQKLNPGAYTLVVITSKGTYRTSFIKY